jgi:type IV pilus assembly protein PilY1
MRRIDIVKWVMVGGFCSISRSDKGGCKQLKGQDSFDGCCQDQTQSVTVAQATGRMPAAYIPSSGNVYFHMMGSSNSLKGSFCVDNDSTKPSGNDCDDGGTYVETKWQIKADQIEEITGVIQDVGSKARFGMMQFKGSGDGGKVTNDVGGNTVNMISAIENTTPSTYTPLAESLYEAGRYFAQIAPAYTNSDYSYNVTTKDPFYFQQPEWASTSQYVTCCKSFVIVFTDGEPTKDTNVPTALQDYAHDIHGAHCTGATTADTCVGHKTNYGTSGSHYLDDVAYYVHKNDLRQATIPSFNLDSTDATGKDLTGTQNLTVYTFYAFGQDIGREVLQAAAKAGGFEDSNGNKLPDLTSEWDRVNNYTGAAGADGIPDTYFESADADTLKDRLLAAITSILQRSASGTSVSVLATSSTGDGTLYQAYFFPQEPDSTVKWTGYTQGLFVDESGNMREDSDGDGKLIYKNDYIIQTRYDSASGEVRVDRYKDLDEDGQADGAAFETDKKLKDIKPIWEAGRRLALKDPSTRKVLTWVDTDKDGVGPGLGDTGEQIEFTQANVATLSPYLRPGAAPFTAANIIDFIRGTQVSSMRDRKVLVTDDAGNSALQVWKLGDPINSTPTVVGAPKERFDVIYGDSSYTAFFTKYKNRRLVAYVGANDGMLHAINGGFYHRGDDTGTSSATERGYFTTAANDNTGTIKLGEELWGFIPYQLLPHLQWLAREDYSHVYYVDLKPKVADVRIFADDTKHPGGWGTVLIGGFRLGGSCDKCVASTGGPTMSITADFGSGSETRVFYSAYFVLDITDPESDPVLLWSFSQADLGLTTSYPAVLRVKPACVGCDKTDNSDAKWFMVVGSGPTGYDGKSAQAGKIFAVNMATGPTTVASFATGDANSFVGDVITLDAQLDYRVDATYAGNVISNGNLTPNWIGKMYRLTTGSGSTDTAAWGVDSGGNRVPTVLLSTFPEGGTTKVGPITAAPTVSSDDSNNIWVYWGTGRLYSDKDKSNKDTQHFFGVKDPAMTGTCAEAGCGEQNKLVNVSAATVCTSGCTNQVTDANNASVTDVLGTDTTTTLQGLVGSKHGWYTTLLPVSGTQEGERDVATPIVLGGIVFFSTFTPDTGNVCASAGSGKLYALFYQTGSAYKESVIGTTESGGKTTVNKSISLGVGLSSQMAVHMGAQGSGTAGSSSGSGSQGGVSLIGQSSTGTITKVSVNPALGSQSRFLSWISQRD